MSSTSTRAPHNTGRYRSVSPAHETAAATFSSRTFIEPALEIRQPSDGDVGVANHLLMLECLGEPATAMAGEISSANVANIFSMPIAYYVLRVLKWA